MSIPVGVIHKKNNAPKITSLVKKLVVNPGEDKIYNIGVPYDMEMNQIYLDKIEFPFLNPLETPDWILFRNETLETGIKFEIYPPESAVGTILQI